MLGEVNARETIALMMRSLVFSGVTFLSKGFTV